MNFLANPIVSHKQCQVIYSLSTNIFKHLGCARHCLGNRDTKISQITDYGLKDLIVWYEILKRDVSGTWRAVPSFRAVSILSRTVCSS